MAGKKAVFYCQNCGHEERKWLGQCPACGEWNTFVEEEVVLTKRSGSKSIQRKEAKLIPLSQVQAEAGERITTKLSEFDRVLGGGIVQGSMVLVGGDPGIGKSTLLLQVCRALGEKGQKVLYISGEESLHQIKLRADRMGMSPENLSLLCETDLGVISEVIERHRPQTVVIDSIQTMYREEISSAPGSVSQVREATGVLLKLAKLLNITIFIVGHVTKEGTVAGPRVLEHMVDTVLYFEGDRHASYRILRGVKNRFGATDEIGVFEMQKGGLAEVKNPSAFLISERPKGACGSVVTCSVEGTRPILLEIQALVSQTSFGFPRRTAVGTDYQRVNLLMAVLEKRIKLPLSQYDAYVNVTGGRRMQEPALDLGIVLAIVSSFRNRPISEEVVAFGEVGLSGEIRGVSMPQQRVNEAKKLGFGVCILPKASLQGIERAEGLKLLGISTVSDAIAWLDS